MEFSIKSGSPEKQRSACVVVGVYEPRKLSVPAEIIDNASHQFLSDIIRRGDMEGKAGTTLLLHNVPGTLADRVRSGTPVAAAEAQAAQELAESGWCVDSPE